MGWEAKFLMIYYFDICEWPFSQKISGNHKKAGGNSRLADQHHQPWEHLKKGKSNFKTFRICWEKKPSRNVFSQEYNEDNSDEGDCGDNDRTERRRGGSSGQPEEPERERRLRLKSMKIWIKSSMNHYCCCTWRWRRQAERPRSAEDR